MTSSPSPLLVLGVCLGLLLILLTPLGRKIAAVAIGLVILVSAKRTFIHETSCPPVGTTACRVELMSTYLGTCWSNNGAILKEDGRYYLTAIENTAARSSCFDVRFWR